VAVVCKIPAFNPFQSSSWCFAGRNGGLITYWAASFQF
jgi:hypothetical protein